MQQLPSIPQSRHGFPGLCPHAGRSWRIFASIAICLFALPGSAFALQTAPGDQPTTSSSIKRITLKPIIRNEPAEVRLKPVLKGQEETEKPKPKTRQRPQPAPKPAQTLVPREQWPVAEGSVALDPAKVESARASLARAKALLERGSSEAARRQLLAIEPQLEGTADAAEARFLAAEALGDLEQARNELRDLVLKYPWAPVTEQALSKIGELSFILGDYDESIKAYRAWRGMAGDPQAAREADLKIAMALLRSSQFQDAEAELARLLAEHPDLSQSPDVLDAHADALLALGRYNEAADLYLNIENRFPNYPFGVKVLMNRGLCAELTGDFEQARVIYRDLIDSYPGSIESSLAGERLQDLERPLVPAAPRAGMPPQASLSPSSDVPMETTVSHGL